MPRNETGTAFASLQSMQLQKPSLWVGALVGLLGTTLSWNNAEAAETATENAPKPIDTKTFGAWDHMEFSMGFLTGQRSYSKTQLNYRSGASTTPGIGTLNEPLKESPFNSVLVAGLRYDVRLVVSYIRMTAGFDLPFPIYDISQTSKPYVISGTQRTVQTSAISEKVLRFGLGGEYPLGPVAPFVDVQGSLHWTNATLAVDGLDAEYASLAFGFSVRGGLRLHVRKWFFAAASGEVGIVGPVRWGAELSVGFSVGGF